MKMEIDLNDIFRDEEGNPDESLEESIRRQVVTRLSDDYRKKLFAKFDSELTRIMQEQISEVIKTRMPEMIEDIMNATYVPVSSYGEIATPTTFRSEIVKAIALNMKYEPKNYHSDENAFTRAVKSIVEAKTDVVKKEITDRVDTQFKHDAIEFAIKKLSERLGLSKP